MSTRGFVGFKKDSNIRGWYNHHDSYYSGCIIDDLSLTDDNEITIVTEGGKVYTLTIKEDNIIYDEE